ncbi:LEPR-XLL domain-containing protein [Skermanella pratensis]|uniref:LEPR-XLL domain-containing protein n=1 Tax=Skermanella pratensis TaxID=2233999 RepID=UPI0013013236|nr:LEPR-XLL domain-containing protein [Skermanella pratensis]
MGVMGLGRRGKRGGLTGMRDHLHMSTSVIALEPRFMFDAAGVATAVDATVLDTGVDPLFDGTWSVSSADSGHGGLLWTTLRRFGG